MPEANEEVKAKVSPKGWRLYMGLGLLGFGFMTPFMIPWVVTLPLCDAMKGTISTLLLVGIPEVATLLAYPLLGKENVYLILGKIKTFLKRELLPPMEVSRTRYTIGLVMFSLPLLHVAMEVIFGVLGQVYGEYETMASVFWNSMFISSFIVLGPSFWDKMAALFIYDARAEIPERLKKTPKKDQP